MTRKECIDRLAAIIAASAFRDDCSASIRSNDWQKGDKDRTYFSIVEKSRITKRYVTYEFGFLDNITGEYHPSKKDLRERFTLSGAIF